MELEEFIEKTLISIKKGINNANFKIAEDDGKVLGKDAVVQYIMTPNNREKRSQMIRFDIAVTVGSEKASEGGGKIKIAVADLGGTKGSISKEESISRIIFEVSPYRDIA